MKCDKKFEQFYQNVIMALGGSIMDVELEEREIRYCFDMAKKTFKQKGHNNYRKKYYRLRVNDCQTIYSLPKEVNMVVKIIRPDNAYGLFGSDEFSYAAFDRMFAGVNKNGPQMSDWLAYDFTLQLIERQKRYILFDVAFHFDELRKTIQIENPPRREEVWLLECYLDLDDEEYMDILWIHNWAVAEAKIMLGNAYRKFSQIPGPDGVISLDGNGLIQEGTQEKERLLEEILAGTDGAVDWFGITMG